MPPGRLADRGRGVERSLTGLTGGARCWLQQHVDWNLESRLADSRAGSLAYIPPPMWHWLVGDGKFADRGYGRSSSLKSRKEKLLKGVPIVCFDDEEEDVFGVRPIPTDHFIFTATSKSKLRCRMAAPSFPSDFLWGTATAAHQVEGQCFLHHGERCP